MKRATLLLPILALTVFGLAGCNSISSQIRSLNTEDTELTSEIRIRSDHSKAIMALVAALEQVKRDGSTAKAERDLASARARYEMTKSKL